jgi:molybdopterin molybdotransferase
MCASSKQIALSFKEARHLVEAHASTLHPRRQELTSLVSSIGRVLAEPITADRDFPSFPRAARDGYALRAEDLKELPARLHVITEIRAGAPSDPRLRIERGMAAAIMTGAAAPPGADAVVMVEHTSRTQSQIEVTKQVEPGENIAPIGSEAKRGDLLLSPGRIVDHTAIALAAAVGKTHVLVYSKPRIAILPTGDEVVDISAQPSANQIRNSNSYSLAAQVVEAGGEPLLLPIAPDEPTRLKELIGEGFEADLLLISGGVSMGKYDLVEVVLEEFHAEFIFTSVQIQPGKPLVFGRIENPALEKLPRAHKYFFGLPGNPVSTMVTFALFARTVVEGLAGMIPRKLVFLQAKAKTEIRTKTGLTRFLPAVLCGEFDQVEVELAGWKGSGDIAAASRANCFVVIPPDTDRIPAGDWVSILRN